MSLFRLSLNSGQIELSKGGQKESSLTFPAKEFSPSGKMKRGDEVEVYFPLRFMEFELDIKRLKPEETRKNIQFQIENRYSSIHQNLIFDFEELESGEDSAPIRKIKVYLVKVSEVLEACEELQILGSGIFIKKISSTNLEGKNLSFLPPQIIESNQSVEKEKRIRTLLRTGGFVFLCVAIASTTSLVFNFLDIGPLNKKIARIQGDYEKALPIYEVQKEKINLLRKKSQMEDSHILLTPALFDFSKVVPQGLYLTRIEREKGEWSLEGRAKDMSLLLSYTKALNQNLSGAKAELRYSENTVDGNVSYKILVR